MSDLLWTIKPYRCRWSSDWLFDDQIMDIARQPFVRGMPGIIDRATRHLPNAERGFLAVFCDRFFIGAQIVLERLRIDGDGCWYRWAETGLEGWLGPKLDIYFFGYPPKRIFIASALLKSNQPTMLGALMAARDPALDFGGYRMWSRQ